MGDFEAKLAAATTLNKDQLKKAQKEAEEKAQAAKIEQVVRVQRQAQELAERYLQRLRDIRKQERALKAELEKLGKHIEHMDKGLAQGKISAMAPYLTVYNHNLLGQFGLEPQQLS